VSSDIRRLLVRAPNWLGDAVLSLGAVRDLRRNFPQARIELLARASVAPLYRAVREIDAVRECVGFRAEIRRLRGNFDLAVLLPNSFASALQAFSAGIPERWGYATDGRGGLLTRRVRVPALRDRSQVYYYRAMLAGLGLVVSASPDISIRCPEDWASQGRMILGEGPWFGLSPGATYGSAKRWLPERYAALGDVLCRRNQARVAIVGSAAERPIGEAIARSMSSSPRVLCGKTSLPELLGVISQFRLLVTNDSGPMHVAASLGVPLVAVFGPTNWRETTPMGTRLRLVKQDVECSPCMLRDCPIDHRCMRRVSIEQVLGEAQALLEGA